MYEPRKPQETAFYKVIQENLRQWLAMVNAADGGWSGVLKHVEKALCLMRYPRSDSPGPIVLIVSMLTLSHFRAKKGRLPWLWCQTAGINITDSGTSD